MERLYHCATRLAVLTSLWSGYSILLAMWMPYRFDLNWISPTSGNKSMPAGLAAATEAEDPWSAVVAQASFWWRGGALPVERGGIRVCMSRCVPRQRRLATEPCQFVEQRYEYLLL